MYNIKTKKKNNWISNKDKKSFFLKTCALMGKTILFKKKDRFIYLFDKNFEI